MAFQTNRIQVDGSINIDGSIYQWNTLFVGGGGGGGGNVSWASGNDGSDNQIITANGDGSIVAESTILFSSNTIYARDTFGVSAPEPLIIRPGNATSSGAGAVLTIKGGTGNSTGAGGDVSINGGSGAGPGDGGNLFLASGYSPGGTAGILQILGGSSAGSTGGRIRIIAGNAAGTAGSVTIKAGSAPIGGDVSINAGLGTSAGPGKIYIGQTDTSALFIGTTTNIPTGTPGTNQMLYVDTADGNRVKRGDAPVDISTLSIESYVNSSTYYDASIAYRRFPEPSTGLGNDDSQGLYCTFTVGGSNTISSGYCCYIDTQGKIQACDADSSSLMPCVTINSSGSLIGPGDVRSLLIYGVIRNTSYSFTIGKPIYVNTSGYPSTSPPTGSQDCVQIIGYAISPDAFIFNPSVDFVILK